MVPTDARRRPTLHENTPMACWRRVLPRARLLVRARRSHPPRRARGPPRQLRRLPRAGRRPRERRVARVRRSTIGRYVVDRPDRRGWDGHRARGPRSAARANGRAQARPRRRSQRRTPSRAPARASSPRRKAMARVAHANVVAVHEVVEADGELFIAMECVDGSRSRRAGSGRPGRAPSGCAWSSSRARARRRARGRARPPRHQAREHPDRQRRAGADHRLRARRRDRRAEPAAGGAASRLVGTVGYLAPEVAAGARGDARSRSVRVRDHRVADAVRCASGGASAARSARARAPTCARRATGRAVRVGGRADRIGSRAPAVPRWPRYVATALAAGSSRSRSRGRARRRAADCDADTTVGGTWTAPRRALFAAGSRRAIARPAASSRLASSS